MNMKQLMSGVLFGLVVTATAAVAEETPVKQDAPKVQQQEVKAVAPTVEKSKTPEGKGLLRKGHHQKRGEKAKSTPEVKKQEVQKQ